MPLPLPNAGQILPEDIDPQAQWPRKYIIDESTGCWIFQGSAVNGYGRARHRGRLEYAHRLFYRLHVGSIPDTMTIDHVAELCSSTMCVNVEHMQVVTNSANAALRQLSEGGTKCKSGRHPWPESKRSYGHNNYCGPCRDEWRSGYDARRREAVNA